MVWSGLYADMALDSKDHKLHSGYARASIVDSLVNTEMSLKGRWGLRRGSTLPANPLVADTKEMPPSRNLPLPGSACGPWLKLFHV